MAVPPEGSRNVQDVGQLCPECRGQRLQAGAIDSSHLADVSLNQPILEQLRDGTFEHRIALQIDERSVSNEPFDQVTGRTMNPSLSPGARTFDNVPM